MSAIIAPELLITINFPLAATEGDPYVARIISGTPSWFRSATVGSEQYAKDRPCEISTFHLNVESYPKAYRKPSLNDTNTSSLPSALRSTGTGIVGAKNRLY